MVTLPIYICSKARPDAPVFDRLRESGLTYVVAVEPQDEEAYAAHPHKLLLGENDRGLAYARQSVLDFIREGHAIRWYWMLDDDLSRFYITDHKERKNHPDKAGNALDRAEAALRFLGRDRPIGIVALEYSQFAWNAKAGQVSWNSYCDCCVLIDSTVLADYRTELPLKVDRDFTLQVLASGSDTLRLRDVSFQVPTNGSNKGGLHDRYADGIEEQASKRMQELWPGIAEAKVKPNGRPDVKINWRAFKR